MGFYQTAEEAPTAWAVLMGSGKPDATPEEVLVAFGKFYPGKSRTTEQEYVHNWTKDPLAFAC